MPSIPERLGVLETKQGHLEKDVGEKLDTMGAQIEKLTTAVDGLTRGLTGGGAPPRPRPAGRAEPPSEEGAIKISPGRALAFLRTWGPVIGTGIGLLGGYLGRDYVGPDPAPIEALRHPAPAPVEP